MRKSGLLLLMTLAACAPKDGAEPATTANELTRLDEIVIESAQAAARARKELAQAEASDRQTAVEPERELQVPAALQRKLTLRWTGPVAPLLSRLADEAGYGFEFEGPLPASGITIRITKYQRSIKQLIDEVGMQLGARATIQVDMTHGLLKLRYNYVG